MWIKKSELEGLSADVKRLIAGEDIDVRDNREGLLPILKNDIHTLAAFKKEQVSVLQAEREVLKDTLADISHQLKTPLTSMMIMADLLEEAPPPKQAEFLANIKISLQRTEWLVSVLLKLAKLDAGTVPFRKENISSSQLIEAALSPLKIQLEIKRQEIEIDGEELIACDKGWTAEALGNVIKNASEHSPAGSIINIQAGANPICKWIAVQDKGIGLEKSQIKKLFNRFEASSNLKGHGIGLPLALTIMRSQAGDIIVEGGGKGVGATFTLKFYKD